MDNTSPPMVDYVLLNLTGTYCQWWQIADALSKVIHNSIPYSYLESPLLDFLERHRELICKKQGIKNLEHETNLVKILKTTVPIEKWSLFTQFLPNNYNEPRDEPLVSKPDNIFTIAFSPHKIANSYPTLGFTKDLTEVMNHITKALACPSVMEFMSIEGIRVLGDYFIVQAPTNPEKKLTLVFEKLLEYYDSKFYTNDFSSANYCSTPLEELIPYAENLVNYLTLQQKLPAKENKNYTAKI